MLKNNTRLLSVYVTYINIELEETEDLSTNQSDHTGTLLFNKETLL